MVVPITPRSIGLTLAVAALVGWFETLSPSPMTSPGAPQQSSRAAAGRLHGTRSTDATIPTPTRLRELMVDTPLPSEGGRNPFVYGPRVAPRRADTRVDASAAPVVVEAPPPALPVFRLSGIASNSENGVPVLTAIVIDNGTMVFVKEGDTLSNGYSVVRVEEMSVTLVDANGVTQTLRLP